LSCEGLRGVQHAWRQQQLHLQGVQHPARVGTGAGLKLLCQRQSQIALTQAVGRQGGRVQLGRLRALDLALLEPGPPQVGAVFSQHPGAR
jgi:hypothetical protein